MIQPLRAIASRTMMSNPFTSSASSANTYRQAADKAQKGEKLNINCADVRSVTRNGHKLDLYA